MSLIISVNTTVVCSPETHIWKTGDTARLSSQHAGRRGLLEILYCSTERKKIFFNWPTRAAKGRTKISCTATTSPMKQQRKTPFIRTLWVSNCFNSPQLKLPAINCRRFRCDRGLIIAGFVVTGDKFIALSWNRWKSGTRPNHWGKRHRR